MGILDSIKSLFIKSDADLLEHHHAELLANEASETEADDEACEVVDVAAVAADVAAASDDAEADAEEGRVVDDDALAGAAARFSWQEVLASLQEYGRSEGYELYDGVERHRGNVLMSSIRNQTIKLHEEILKYYVKQNKRPDDKRLNLLTVTNIFYIAMGSALLAKVKRSNLIAQGVFQKLMQKSGPECFYREVAALAGHKYGDDDSEKLHTHVQRAAYMLLQECDKKADNRKEVIECAKGMYMYGLCVSLR